jgi:hypothetical protein
MPNETTRLERAWNFNTEKLAHGEKGYTVVDALNDFATQECAVLEKENEKLRYKWDSETCGRCGYMRSPVSFCKCGQFGIVGTNDQLRLQIESLTAQLSEAKSELQKYQELFGIVPTLEDVENGTTELL